MLIQQLKEQRKEKQKPTKMLHTKHNNLYICFLNVFVKTISKELK